MIALALDASTYSGSVAVVRDGALVGEADAAMRDRHRETLMPAVDAVLTRAGIGIGEIDRIVCGAGPGSFTSLRIAAGLAKGLCFGLGRPLFAISSLALIVGGLPDLARGKYLAALDALRGQSYVACFGVNDQGDVFAESPMLLVTSDAVPQVARELKAEVVGPAQTRYAPPRARGILRAEELYLAPGPVNMALWEPDYGRKAEAQVRWEAAHGRPLSAP